MSLVGMRHALGEALSHAASRKQVDAVIALVQMVESDFEDGMSGSNSLLGSVRNSANAARQCADANFLNSAS